MHLLRSRNISTVEKGIILTVFLTFLAVVIKNYYFIQLIKMNKYSVTSIPTGTVFCRSSCRGHLLLYGKFEGILVGESLCRLIDFYFTVYPPLWITENRKISGSRRLFTLRYTMISALHLSTYMTSETLF